MRGINQLRCSLIFLLSFFITASVQASNTCTGKLINPVTDICWSCLFPMTIGASQVTHSKLPDTKNPSNPICVCPGNPVPRVGLSLGFWEPISLVDVTRTPFCMVNLGGLDLSTGNFKQGMNDTSNTTGGNAFYHVHWYHYPLIAWLNLITDAGCFEGGDFDIAYFTEFDPTWQDDSLSLLFNPEAALFANPIAQTACIADAISSTFRLPIDALYWCAGAQGSLYPLSGHIEGHHGGVQAAGLLSERLTYKLHRALLITDTKPEKLCMPYHAMHTPKSRYRYQLTNPKSTSNQCNPFGRTSIVWESGIEVPVTGENFGFLIWRKRNCCAF